jgi:Trk-type K+ transport system membrane component
MKWVDCDMTNEQYDLNGDGVIDEVERRIMLEDMRRKMEDEDAQRDSIRKMAWFALFGLLLYPFGIFLANAFGMDTAANLIADIAPTYFASIAVLVSAFFGASAISGKKDK